MALNKTNKMVDKIQPYNFFSLSKGMTRQVSLPQANGKKCFSSQVWLITIEKNLKINLLYPFLQIQKELSDMKTLLYGDLWFSEHDPFLFAKIFDKFELSASPSQKSDYIVMSIYDSLSKLAFCQPRDKLWTIITTNFIPLMFGETFLLATLEAQILG